MIHTEAWFKGADRLLMKNDEGTWFITPEWVERTKDIYNEMHALIGEYERLHHTLAGPLPKTPEERAAKEDRLDDYLEALGKAFSSLLSSRVFMEAHERDNIFDPKQLRVGNVLQLFDLQGRPLVGGTEEEALVALLAARDLLKKRNEFIKARL